MRYKKASIISLAVFGIIGAYAYFEALSFPGASAGVEVGPGYYPKLLGIIMVITSIVGIITSYRGEDHHIDMPNMKYFIFVLVCVVLLAAVWQITGAFFVCVFVVAAAMFFGLNQSERSFKKVYYSIFLSLGFTLFVYVVFDKVLRIAF